MTISPWRYRASALAAAERMEQMRQDGLAIERLNKSRMLLAESAWAPSVRIAIVCSACGSREFRDHNGAEVCAYCRTGRGA